MSDPMKNLIRAITDPAGYWEERCAKAETRLSAAKTVLAERERELLTLKGSCSTDGCRLHYAHAGPCDVTGGDDE